MSYIADDRVQQCTSVAASNQVMESDNRNSCMYTCDRERPIIHCMFILRYNLFLILG